MAFREISTKICCVSPVTFLGESLITLESAKLDLACPFVKCVKMFSKGRPVKLFSVDFGL